MRLRRWAYVTAALCLAALPLQAGETGSISGVVKDTQGGVLPGASVRVSGELLPGGLESVSDDGGGFRFLRLLPGAYRIVASLSGMGQTAQELAVRVDVDAYVTIVLQPSLEEEVTVVAATPVADMSTTEVNFNYSSESIEKLPLRRTYAGLFQLIPGVADNNSFAPSAGGSRQDNTFLVDGVNITNPGFGYLATEINELDIVEFNIKRAGISAEFGRSSGAVTNAVTRSGTNELSGTLRFEAQPESFTSDPKDPTLQEVADDWVPALGIGGPILRDKVWWYASGRFFRSTLTDRVNRTGPVPDRDEEINELFGKLTARPSDKHFLSASFRNRPRTVDFAGVGSTDSAETATNSEGTNRIATVTWSLFPTETSVVDVKLLRLEEENEDVAVTDLGDRGSFDVANPSRMGRFVDPATGFSVGGASLKLNRLNYTRNELKLSYTQFFDLGSTSHQLKAGFGYETTEEDLTRVSNAWGSVGLVQGGTQYATNYYPDQPSQLGKSRTYALFLQDAIRVNERLTINAGLLLNRDEFIQETDVDETFLSFDFFDEVQPRVGFNFNLREGAGDKLYGNYGRYYSLDQKSTSRSLAPRRLFTQDTIFSATTGALVSDAPNAATTGKVIDPDVQPTYQDEFLVGYATPIVGNWGVDVFFMFRDLSDVIEDFPRTPPASDFWYSNVPEAERRFRALTVELNRRLADRWALNLSYAWTRLYGNFDIDYATRGVAANGADAQIFNTSSALEDGPGLAVTDEFRFGPLVQDRTHVFKLFGTFLPTERLTLGGYFRVQSGTPWAARGRDWYNGFRRYLEPASARRNDAWANLDLLASYKLDLGERVKLTLEGRVLNVFDTQTVLTRDDRLFLDGRIRNFSSPPFLVQGTTQPNGAFGEPTTFAPPRRLLLTLLVDF